MGAAGGFGSMLEAPSKVAARLGSMINIEGCLRGGGIYPHLTGKKNTNIASLEVAGLKVLERAT